MRSIIALLSCALAIATPATGQGQARTMLIGKTCKINAGFNPCEVRCPANTTFLSGGYRFGSPVDRITVNFAAPIPLYGKDAGGRPVPPAGFKVEFHSPVAVDPSKQNMWVNAVCLKHRP